MGIKIAGDRKRRRTFIKAWRKYRGMSQAQLADRLGTTNSSISRIEHGLQPYSQEVLEAIAEALMCEPGDLLTRAPSQDAIWTVWETASDSERGTIVEIAKTIIGRRPH